MTQLKNKKKLLRLIRLLRLFHRSPFASPGLRTDKLIGGINHRNLLKDEDVVEPSSKMFEDNNMKRMAKSTQRFRPQRPLLLSQKDSASSSPFRSTQYFGCGKVDEEPLEFFKNPFKNKHLKHRSQQLNLVKYQPLD